MKKLLFCTVFMVLGVKANDLPNAAANIDEWQQRHQIIDHVYHLYSSQQFEALAALFEQYSDPQEKLLDGSPKLTVFFQSLRQIYGLKTTGDQFWQAHESYARSIMDDMPQSPLGYFIYVDVLMHHAELYQNYCFCEKTAAERKLISDRMLEEALAFLLQHERWLSRYAHWYTLMLSIAEVQSWPLYDFEVLAEKGINAFPTHFPLYYVLMSYFDSSKTDATHVDSIVQRLFDRYNDEDAVAEAYAWAALVLMDKQKNNRPLHEYSIINWQRLKSSINVLVERYPMSSNINNSARLSCMAGDPDMTMTLISQIDNDMIELIWKDKAFFQACKEWASDVAHKSTHTSL